MNLDRPTQSTSFYEVFTDLIFATMAIFVMLMLAFVVQVSAANASAEAAVTSNEELRVELEAKGSELATAQADLDREKRAADNREAELREAAKEIVSAKEEIDLLRPSVIELVIAIDGSRSMKEVLDLVQLTVEQA
ncbi:MAG: hypothetical protein AAGG01_20400, partial [Planctomycetota bacterium]